MEEEKLLEEGMFFNYKAFYIYVDEVNSNNPDKRLINIYKSKQDFIDGDVEETVSLNCEGLTLLTIQQYIDENIINDNKKGND